jgi:transposase-like protein
MPQSILDKPFFQNEIAAYAKLESIIWPNGPVCPHCGDRARIRLMGGKATRPGLYNCYACRQQFRATVGTVFHASHVPLHMWLQAVYLMVSSKKGVSTHQMQRAMGVALKSTWFMTLRIREAMKTTDADKLGGYGAYVEADETYVGRKEGTKLKGPGTKNTVMSLVERGGRVRSFHVPNVTAANLRPIVGKHVYADSKFQSDESPIYTGIGWHFQSHGVVKHSAKEYVRCEDYTNTIEGFFSIVERGIYGICQYVSEAHLHRYLAEVDFRYSYRIKTGFDDMARMDKALAGIVGRRLTYRSVGGAGAAKASTWTAHAGSRLAAGIAILDPRQMTLAFDNETGS